MLKLTNILTYIEIVNTWSEWTVSNGVKSNTSITTFTNSFWQLKTHNSWSIFIKITYCYFHSIVYFLGGFFVFDEGIVFWCDTNVRMTVYYCTGTCSRTLNLINMSHWIYLIQCATHWKIQIEDTISNPSSLVFYFNLSFGNKNKYHRDKFIIFSGQEQVPVPWTTV